MPSGLHHICQAAGTWSRENYNNHKGVSHFIYQLYQVMGEAAYTDSGTLYQSMM